MRLPFISWPHAPNHKQHRSAHVHLLKKILPGVALCFTTCGVLAFQAPKAQALDEIKLAYGNFQFGSLSVQDLTSFSTTKQAPQSLQSLLNTIKLDQKTALQLLTTNVKVDRNLLKEVSQTFVGESLLQLAGTTITIPNSSKQNSEHIRDALLAAAADNRVSAIEFIQKFEANSVVVKTDKVGQVSEQIKKDISTIQQFLTKAFL